MSDEYSEEEDCKFEQTWMPTTPQSEYGEEICDASNSDLKQWLREEEVDARSCIERKDLVRMWNNIKKYSKREMDNRCAITPIKKVIFLDVDGVLNTTHNFAKQILPEKIEYIIDILDKTDASIVLSTTWRDPPPRRRFLLQYLEKHGILLTKIIGQTSDLGFFRRSEEIEQWITDHNTITRFIVLDDFDYEWTPFILPRVIKTDDTIGVTEENTKMVINLLNCTQNEWDQSNHLLLSTHSSDWFQELLSYIPQIQKKDIVYNQQFSFPNWLKIQ